MENGHGQAMEPVRYVGVTARISRGQQAGVISYARGHIKLTNIPVLREPDCDRSFLCRLYDSAETEADSRISVQSRKLFQVRGYGAYMFGAVRLYKRVVAKLPHRSCKLFIETGRRGPCR